MAILSPTIEVIKRQKVQPTEGEWTLLNFLLDNLDDTYEIYYQPYLNGDNPDFAIMRKGSGVLLIEVKDWNLNHYYVDERTKWRLQKDNTFIKSPLNQVENYKSNLFHLHLEELFKKSIKSKNHWATVNCAVYFHKATEQNLTSFLLDGFNKQEDEPYRKFVSYFGLLGYNSLTKDKKLVSIVFPPGSQGKQMVANYRYDDQGRLIEIVQENPYLVTFTFTYMLDGRVEKIKVLKDFFDQKYIDYTFFMKAKARYPTGLDTVAPCLHIPPML